MSNEVTVKKSTAVSTEFAGMFDNSLASAGDTLDKADLRIPKLTMIQPLTKKAFNTEEAATGNFINSIEKTDLGNSMDIFVMSDTKLWELKYQAGKGSPEYLGTIDYTRDNEDLKKNPRIPSELLERAKENNVTLEMLKAGQINMINRFYVLLVSEVMEGTAFPYIVDFKRSSYPAGLQLKNTFFKMKKTQGLPSYARAFSLYSEFIQDEHDYYVKKVSSGRMISEEEIQAVELWVREMMNNRDAYQDDDTSEEDFVEDTNTIEVQAEDTLKY